MCSNFVDLNVTAPLVEPWIQTEGGNVGVHEGVTMTRDPDSPAISGDNADYLVLADGLIANFKSAKWWLVGSGTPGDYAVDLHGLDSYDAFFEEYDGLVEGTVTVNTNLTSVQIQSTLNFDGGVMLWSGDITSNDIINYDCGISY